MRRETVPPRDYAAGRGEAAVLRRRGVLAGLGLLAAPAIIRTPGLLMPVRTPLWQRQRWSPIVQVDAAARGGRVGVANTLYVLDA